MIRLTHIKAPLGFKPSRLTELAAKALRVRPDEVLSAQMIRKSVDARKKSDVHFVLTLDVELKPGVRYAMAALPQGTTVETVKEIRYHYPTPAREPAHRPVIVGLGPAGLFAAVTLARAGMRPIVLERGRRVEDRARDVGAFFAGGPLNPESNVQFGEGGAGAFSDGKLNTGIHDPRIREVLRSLHEAGAPEEILYEAKPHIGTDRLPEVVRALREEILLLGGDVYFECRMTGLSVADGRLTGLTALRADGSELYLPAERLILAVGHSARDTFSTLYEQSVEMIAKPFAIGVRVEHPQAFIDRAQFGSAAGHPALGAAEYKLNVRLPSGRTVHTFCMCPGGTVVAAASEPGGVVTNGMSAFARDLKNANSALLVGVTPADFPGEHPLSGMEFQRTLERQAFVLGGGNHFAPAERMDRFLNQAYAHGTHEVEPTYRPGVTEACLNDCLPDYVMSSLREGIALFDRKIPGFAAPGAWLTGVETRSSSPVRIPRGEDFQANIRGLYPAGEGAGYAGGILSAAVDGMRSAEAVISTYQG